MNHNFFFFNFSIIFVAWNSFAEFIIKKKIEVQVEELRRKSMGQKKRETPALTSGLYSSSIVFQMAVRDDV